MNKFHLFKAHINQRQALNLIKTCFVSGYLNEGVLVNNFKEELQKYLDIDIVLTNSCTSAITLALKLCDVENNDDVVSTSMTCVATNTPITNLGANIVWCDIDKATGMLCPTALEKTITQKTKAVIYVAWAGNLGNINEIYDICKRKNVKLILDAAHSFGSKFDNKNPAKNVADIVCYSFQAIKHITTGDGGAIAIDKSKYPDLFSRANRLKWFGLDRDKSKDEKGDWKGQQWDVDIEEAGYKFNMNNIAAAIGLSQLKSIDKIMNKHKNNALLYDKLFFNTEIKPLQRSKSEDSSRWVYTVTLSDDISKYRLQIIEELNNNGIMAGVVHIPNHHYTCFKKFYKKLDNVDCFFNSQFSLPCGWWLTKKDIKHIANKTIQIIEKYKHEIA